MKKVKILEKIVVVFLSLALLTTLLLNVSKAETQPVDPTPNYFDTSSYMLGNCSVLVYLTESNGSIDINTKNWTTAKFNQVKEKIEYIKDWLESLNPGVIDFIVNYSIVETSYEPDNRTAADIHLWIHEIMRSLGYENPDFLIQCYDCVNDVREKLNTNWCFIIWVINGRNFVDGGIPFAAYGGPMLFESYDKLLVDNITNSMLAHEWAHIFQAYDEKSERFIYGGYLNASNVPMSGCLMSTLNTLKLSGEHTNYGTWAQIGWTDDDNDSIPNIVDTIPSISNNPPEISVKTVKITGQASVNPFPNLGKIGSGNNFTINTIQKVQANFNGTWLDAQISPTTVQKLHKYPNVYINKTTYSVVNWNFSTELEPGNHTVEIRATDSWNNTITTSTTVTISTFLPTDLNQDGTVNILDISIVARAFGSKPGDPTWNAIADIDKNNWVNIVDISLVAKDYGKTT